MCEKSKISPAIKAQILDSLAKIQGQSFVAYSIGLFVADAHLKTDMEIIELIENLQDQMKDNDAVMKSILKNQYEFIKSVSVEMRYSRT